MGHYIMHPSSVKGLAAEIIRVCDDYQARKLPEAELRRIIHQWANSYGHMLFAGPGSYNPTVAKIIGTKRLRLVGVMLEGFQISII